MSPSRLRQRFEALTLPYLDRLLAAARRRVESPELAEDLVQDTYLCAWKAFRSLDDELRVYAWLLRILHRQVADHYRRHARRHALLPITDLEAHYHTLAGNEDQEPLRRLSVALARSELDELLARLPTEFARALELHDLEGLRYREIADILEVPTGTVMSRIHRGRRLLIALASQSIGADDVGTGPDAAAEQA